ncbi:hypothetical protein SI65_08251 [Aspergillus cristatus]|uniref:Uncharacterized protein n=1 Tax=Aspergillus cristatus TaxID=573508 RepID=A0A1E3B5M6_ASPCR|nr:hypothetical protein SI65_08251 [Aspergillus cristatus]
MAPFIPTPAEIKKAVDTDRSYRRSTPSDLNDKKLTASGSNWDEEQLEALRVILLEPLPLHRLIPPGSISLNNDEVYSDLVDDLKAPSLDDLKEWRKTEKSFMKANNKFIDLFSQLGLAISTREATVHSTTGYIRDPSATTDLTTSSNENVDEEPSRQSYMPLVKPIQLHDAFPDVVAGGYEYSLRVQSVSGLARRMSPYTAKNDGGIVICRDAAWSGATRYGKIPVASFEVGSSQLPI